MSTFIAELVAVAVILFVIFRYIAPRVREPLARRQALIDKQVEDAERSQQQLAEAERAYQNAVTEARTQAAQIRETARAEAQRTVEDLRTQAQEEHARIIARGEDQLANQRSAVIRELRGEIGTLAVELSEKLVDQRLARADEVSSTVDAFIGTLEHDDSLRSGVGARPDGGPR